MAQRLWAHVVMCARTVLVSASMTTASFGAEYDLCARGLGYDLVRPFVQTLRVRLSVLGVEVDEPLQKQVFAQLIQASVWPDRASEVFVEAFDTIECAASGGNEISIEAAITPPELDSIRATISRGEGALAQLKRIAQRAVVGLAQSSTTPAARNRWLRVYYATNRQATGSAITANAFGMARANALSYGAVDVAVLHQNHMSEVESPAIFKFEQASSLDGFSVAGSFEPLSRDQWLETLRQRASRFENPGVLLFVHGYNVSFVDAARRSAQLAYDLAFPGPTVFFSWPSDQSVIQYLRDGRDAENSWGAAASLLSDVTGLLPNGPVYVIAHSMGNRVMLGGLMRLMEDSPGRRRAIRSVIMAAPDIDQETFTLNIARKVLNLGMHFTLYASARDLALGSSEFLQGGKRLGMGGASLFLMNGIDSVDASAVTREFFGLNHAYFGDKTAVLSDIFYLVRAGLPPHKRPNLKQVRDSPVAAWAIQ
jgi:esterase/lipase superfamily enzyme